MTQLRGQNCLQAARTMLFKNKLQMEIKGQGDTIVQIAPWCPPGAMCVQPQASADGSTAEGEADAEGQFYAVLC